MSKKSVKPELSREELVFAITIDPVSQDVFVTSGEMERTKDMSNRIIEVLSVVLGKKLANIDSNSAKCYASLGVAMSGVTNSFAANLQTV